MPSKSTMKTLRYLVAIPVVGFILLNAAFMLDYAIQITLRQVLRLGLHPGYTHLVFIAVVLAVSPFILRSRLPDLLKATYLTVPVAVTLVTIGMFLFERPVLVYTVGGAFIGATVLCLRLTQKAWFYYYGVILVTVALVVMGLLGLDI